MNLRNSKNYPKSLESKSTYIRISAPENLDIALEGLVRKVLKDQPKADDIYAFAADYFESLLEIREKAGIKKMTVNEICPFHNDEDAHEMVKLATTFARPVSEFQEYSSYRTVEPKVAKQIILTEMEGRNIQEERETVTGPHDKMTETQPEEAAKTEKVPDPEEKKQESSQEETEDTDETEETEPSPETPLTAHIEHVTIAEKGSEKVKSEESRTERLESEEVEDKEVKREENEAQVVESDKKKESVGSGDQDAASEGDKVDSVEETVQSAEMDATGQRSPERSQEELDRPGEEMMQVEEVDESVAETAESEDKEAEEDKDSKADIEQDRETEREGDEIEEELTKERVTEFNLEEKPEILSTAEDTGAPRQASQEAQEAQETQETQETEEEATSLLEIAQQAESEVAEAAIVAEVSDSAADPEAGQAEPEAEPEVELREATPVESEDSEIKESGEVEAEKIPDGVEIVDPEKVVEVKEEAVVSEAIEVADVTQVTEVTEIAEVAQVLESSQGTELADVTDVLQVTDVSQTNDVPIDEPAFDPIKEFVEADLEKSKSESSKEGSGDAGDATGKTESPKEAAGDAEEGEVQSGEGQMKKRSEYKSNEKPEESEKDENKSQEKSSPQVSVDEEEVSLTTEPEVSESTKDASPVEVEAKEDVTIADEGQAEIAAASTDETQSEQFEKQGSVDRLELVEEDRAVKVEEPSDGAEPETEIEAEKKEKSKEEEEAAAGEAPAEECRVLSSDVEAEWKEDQISGHSTERKVEDSTESREAPTQVLKSSEELSDPTESSKETGSSEGEVQFISVQVTTVVETQISQIGIESDGPSEETDSQDRQDRPSLEVQVEAPVEGPSDQGAPRLDEAMNVINAAIVIQKGYRRFRARKLAQKELKDSNSHSVTNHTHSTHDDTHTDTHNRTGSCGTVEPLRTTEKEGSSVETDSSVSSSATKINTDELPKRSFTRSTTRSLLESQSLDSTKKSVLTKTRSLSTSRQGVTDFEIWSAIEKELEAAATKIQSNFRGYRTRKRLKREDAVQITMTGSEASASSETLNEIAACESSLSHHSTGEFHDTIVLSVHPH